ncbi:hypothetical protein QMJ87_09675 [Acinetobacter baumannii]|nr:hypothetical protein [Acinetobacter baumannii]
MSIGTLVNCALGSATGVTNSEILGSLLLSGRGRTIMGLFTDLTIEEKHKDELKITEYPTKVGALSADKHKMPQPFFLSTPPREVLSVSILEIH